LVGAGTVKGVGFLVIDSFHFKALVKSTPLGGFVSMNDRSLGNAGADESGGLALSAKHGRNRIAAAFANYHYDLTLTVLIAA
jgi:hypothetical protein